MEEGIKEIMEEEERSRICREDRDKPIQSGIWPGKEKPEELNEMRRVRFCRGSTEKVGFNAPLAVLLRPVSVIEMT